MKEIYYKKPKGTSACVTYHLNWMPYLKFQAFCNLFCNLVEHMYVLAEDMGQANDSFNFFEYVRSRE